MLPERSGGDTRAVGVPWGEFATNVPREAHVASAAPPAARFGHGIDFQTEAAVRFALGGIVRGERVLLIGSRWQYRSILRRLEELGSELRKEGGATWRERDVAALEAEDLQSELMVDNVPDGARFATFIERAGETTRGSRQVRVHVWNDLGARFYLSGHRRACRAIERLWHQARPLGYTILCSYALPDGSAATLGGLGRMLEYHTHVVRAGPRDVAIQEASSD